MANQGTRLQCTVCGSKAVVMIAGDGEPTCCGQPMEPA
jgi:desulfoferrodoxin-like iron-binding protein